MLGQCCQLPVLSWWVAPAVRVTLASIHAGRESRPGNVIFSSYAGFMTENTWPRDRYTGPDGGLYTGPGGGEYTGPGGGRYTGPGGGLYTGPGGGLYTGPGGGLYAGPCSEPYRSNRPPMDVFLKYLREHGLD